MKPASIAKLTLFSLLLAGMSICAGFGGEAYGQSENVTPERIILTLPGDPATTMAVTWRTEDAAPDSKAELASPMPTGEDALKAHSPTSSSRYVHLEEQASSVAAKNTMTNTDDERDVYYHNVIFDGLKPDTLYAYRVGSGETWSEWNQFRTAPATANSYSFIFMGDAQNDIFSAWSPVVRNCFRNFPNAAFYLFGGDLVGDGEEDADWEEWFNAADWIFRTTPVMATPGNHEYYDVSENEDALTWLWPIQFAFPDNGPDEYKQEAWYLDYLDSRIISLNSKGDLDTQAEWVAKVLDDAKDRWTVVTFHHPVYSSGRGRDNPELRAAWKPIFEEHGADLILMGHDHTYARTARLIDGKEVDGGEQGVVYLNSVSGPKQYSFDAKYGDLFKRTAEGTQLYSVIEVAADSLKVDTYAADGSLYDSFELDKKDDGIAFVDRVPATPERRRPLESK